MSRAFVKEDDASGDPLPDMPISSHPNYVTADGLALIERHLARLQSELAAAADDRARRAAVERDLRYWGARRASAEVIPRPTGEEVRFGATVTINRDGRRQTWQIVGEDEADPARGTISYTSPLARALLGRTVGDIVALGGGEAEIVSVE